MARLRVTGKGPVESSFNESQEGAFIDVPSQSPYYQELVEKGWAEEVEPADDPGRTPVQIANSVIRGDSLANPHDAAVASDLYGDYAADDSKARAVVHTQDPDAKPADVDKAIEQSLKDDDLVNEASTEAALKARKTAATAPKSSSDSKS